MRNRITKLIFPFIAILLLAPWPIAYAYTYEGEMTSQGAVRVEAADASVAPSAIAFGRSVGSVTPGDLFYINAIDSASDFSVTIHMTNAGELSQCYRYFVVELVAYVQDETGSWVRTTAYDNQDFNAVCLDMKNGNVSFSLPGCARYKLAVEGGSFYCMAISADGGSLAPNFYLTVD